MKHRRAIVTSAAAALTLGASLIASPASADAAVINLTSLSFAQTTVDASTGSGAVELDWSIIDSSSKARTIGGDISIREEGATPGSFVGPTYDVTFGTSWDGTIQVLASSGDASNSSYIYSFPVPQYATASNVTWAISKVTLRDDVSHHRSLTGPQLGSGPTAFDATEAIDSTPPTYESLSLGANQADAVYNKDTPATITYQFIVEDSESGAATGTLTLTGPAGQTITQPFQLVTPQPGFGTTCGDSDGGSPQFAFCVIGVPIAANTTAGAWNLTAVDLADALGNHKHYGDLLFGPVTVTQNSAFTADNFALDPAQLDNWQATATSQLKMKVTGGSAEITSVLTDGTCFQPSTTPTNLGNGVIAVPISLRVLNPGCDIDGIKITDSSGNVSVYGSPYGNSALSLHLSPTPDTTPPIATSAALSITSIPASSTPREFDLTASVVSQVGVTGYHMTVYNSAGSPVGGSDGGLQQTTNGTVSMLGSVSALTPGVYTVGFTLEDAGGLYTTYNYPGMPSPPWGPLQFTVTAG